MSKRYLQVIEVEAPSGSVRAFWWRGRRYGVRRILARWRETGGWWKAAADAPWAGESSREILRVQAAGGGIYEIARDLRTGAWSMHRVYD